MACPRGVRSLPPRRQVRLLAATATAAQTQGVLEENNKTLETEKEFYFNKLQYLEEIITKNGLDKHDFGAALLDVMYAAEGDTIMINENSVEIATADGGRKKMTITAPVPAGEAEALIEDQPMEEQPLMDEDN